VENSECLDCYHTTYVVEVPVREHGLPEVVEAKLKEIENLKFF
jgi:hypothetical protein